MVPPFPGRFGDGLHTIAGAGPVTVVDGKRRVVVPTALPAKMLSYRRSKVVVPRPGSAPGPADAPAAEEAAGREEPAVDGDDRSHVDRAR